MKKIYTLSLCILMAIGSFAQTEPFLPDTFALESIIVEKYYASNADDVPAGLSEGSITYRVYADLKPGYTVLNFTAFSVHPISIRVTDGGQFYNNGFGTTFGADLNPALFAVDAAAGVDSWLAIGGASDSHFGILKQDDEDDSSLLAGSPLGYLNNDQGFCLPSLQDQDGLIEQEVPSITSLGLDTDQLSIFGTASSSENFEVNDITVAVLGGVLGIGDENRVLLGQFTTMDGTLEFDINIQIGIPEELQCDVIPSCEKSSIWYTYSFDPQDSADNENPDLNYVTYQNDGLSYVDDGAPCTLSVNDLDRLDNAFTIAPNPTNGTSLIQLSESIENARYELYSVTGKLVDSKNVGNLYPGASIEVDLSEQNSGVYLVRLISNESFAVKQVVKY